MYKRIAAFTIVTFLLFTVSIATIDVSKSSTESSTVADSDVVLTVLSTEPLDKSTANEPLPESENTQTFHVRSIEPSIPIQRHFFDRSTRIPLRFVRRHPCRKFKKMLVNQNMRSYGNDMIVSDKVTSVDLEAIGDRIPTKWLEFKHKYGHRHHHYHHDRDEMMNSVSGQHKEKKREHKGGFMRRVRKFLKHTFD